MTGRRWRLVVSIINYRTPDMTWACVQSCLDDLHGRTDVLTVVIDNASPDGSGPQLAGRFAALPPGTPAAFMQSATNSGFAGGHNQVMRAHEADWYLLLNSDALLRPGCIAALLSAAQAAGPHEGLLSPTITDEEGRPSTSLFRFATPFSEFIRGANSGPITKALRRWDVPLYGTPDPAQIGWASFAAIALRDEMVRQIGLMDEGYFMYFEDVDYCLRARRAGWRIRVVPEAVVMHDEGGSGDLVEAQRAIRKLPDYYYASRTRFLTQAHGWLGYVAANAAYVVGRGLNRVRPLLGQERRPARPGEARGLWLNAMRPRGNSHAPR